MGIHSCTLVAFRRVMMTNKVAADGDGEDATMYRNGGLATSKKRNRKTRQQTCKTTRGGISP